jgi:signal peptidase I
MPTEQAQNMSQRGLLGFKRKDWEFIKTVVVAVLLAMLFRSFFFEPFHIPSSSMKSNLLIGDYIFVTKYAYGYSRYSFPFGIDFFDGRIGSGNRPKRGDVVVFRPPGEPGVDYIKRVMGLPGDRIQMKDGVVYINGAAVPKRKVDTYSDTEDNVTRDIDRYEETLPEGKKYQVLDATPDGQVDNTEEYVVPPKHYFMMGDNRDNSRDSRYATPVGYVPEENIVGRADIVMLSFDGLHPRWGRFFKPIN